MSVSKRVRFEVFKRDGFKCAYCGATPNDGPLHVDHVDPKAGGGSDDPANLVTACAACNLGKSDVPLSARPARRAATPEELEQSEQLLEYLEYQRQLKAAKEKLVDFVCDHWADRLGNVPTDFEPRAAKALGEFSPTQLTDAIDIVAGRLGSYGKDNADSEGYLPRWVIKEYENRLRYWYGILRNWRQAK